MYCHYVLCIVVFVHDDVGDEFVVSPSSLSAMSVVTYWYWSFVSMLQQRPKSKSHWVDDDTQNDCMICAKKFTVTNRRHHCRWCGHLVCANCSSKKWKVSKGDPKRVCDQCYKRLSEGSEDQVNLSEIPEDGELQKLFEELLVHSCPALHRRAINYWLFLLVVSRN